MNTKNVFRALLLMLFFAFAGTQLSNAQTQKPAQQQQRGGGEASAATKSRGSDPEIKEAQPQANVRGQQPEGFVQPIEKGATPRGDYSYCSVVVDNYTSWWLDVYVDGSYRGKVSPWGDGYVNVGAGNTKAYVVAEFTDGSRVTWGPVTQSCYDQFDLTIREGSYTYEAR